MSLVTLVAAPSKSQAAFTPQTVAMQAANPSNCYPAGRAQQMLAAFKLTQSNFGASAGDLCNPDSDLVKLLKGFDFVENLRFAEPVYKSLAAPGFLTTGYLSFIQTNIHQMEYHPDLGCNKEMICVVADTTLAGYMRLGRPFFEESVIERATTLVHETRHTIGDGYPHVDCVKGTYVDASDSCDESFAYAGAYGVEVELDTRIYHSALNASAVLRGLAREDAIDGLQNRFNAVELVSTPIDTAILVADDGKIGIFDGENLLSPAVKVQAKSLILVGADSLDENDGAVTVLPGDRTSRATAFQIHTLNSDDQNQFNQSGIGPLDTIYRWLTGGNRKLIKDAMLFQNNEVVLYASSLVVAPTSGTNAPQLLSLAGISDPQLVSYAPFCDEYDKTNTHPITIRAADNSVYFVDARSLSLRKSSCRFPAGLKEIVRLNQKRYGLTSDGRLVYVSDMSTMSDVPAAQGMKFGTLKKLLGHMFRSFAP